MPPRSLTSPMLRRSPSPDLPLSQECAFPVFPASRSTTPTTPKKPPGRSHADGQAVRPPMGERLNQGNNVIKRMNSIAPGPFTVKDSSANGVGEKATLHKRTATTSSVASTSRASSPSSIKSRTRRPSTSGSDAIRKGSFSNSRPRLEEPTSSGLIPSIPQRIDDVPIPAPLSIAGVRLPFSEPTKAEEMQNREFGEAPTAPLPRRPQNSVSHFRQPSVSAANRPLHEIGSAKSHRPTQSRGISPPTTNTDVNPNFHAPRSASATGFRNERKLDDVPPVPGIASVGDGASNMPRSASAMESRTGSRPFDVPPLPNQGQVGGLEGHGIVSHAPTESVSSDGSGRSNGSNTQTTSSRSSPPMSTSSYGSTRKQSDGGNDQFPSFGSVATAPITSTDAQLRPRRGPAKSFSRPTYANPVEPREPESPMDPDMQAGRLPPIVTNSDKFPPPSARPVPFSQSAITPPHRDTPNFPSPPQYSQSATTPSFRDISNFPTPPRSPHPLPLQPPPRSPARRPTVASKGNCRGCGETIIGKSVSSADGRLTGRYHKQCFVCKTCKQPFQTSDFYVLGNHPYCGRHYHELNRSLCTNCDRGIEGQYVETDMKHKFHPHCFNCRVSSYCALQHDDRMLTRIFQECHLILRDDYFEVNGKILCEQHAFRSDFLGPGRRFPEKRSTRLMMMM